MLLRSVLALHTIFILKEMAQNAANSLSPAQKAQLHQVADLTLDIYETLARMRFLDPQEIIRGPHQPDQELLAEYKQHNLDPSIIYLYSILPYVSRDGGFGRVDFFHGSSFADFRKPETVERGRDPLYASPEGDFDDENGEYMRPWYTPLSEMGNHQSVIIYDAKQHHIWVIDQEGGSTTDPALCKGWHEEEPKEESNWGDSDGSSYEEDEEHSDETDSNGSSEFWDDDDEAEENEVEALQRPEEEEVDFDEGFELVEDEGMEEPKNRNSIEHIRSRPADVFLRDVKRWYLELKELPGQGEYNHAEWALPHKTMRSLYTKNRWPGDDFDGDQFEVDQIRAYCAERAKYFAEEPLRQVQCYDGWRKYSDRDIVKYSAEAADAKTPDEEWSARFQLFLAETRRDRNLRDLDEAKTTAEKLCPGGKCQREPDLPLWELEMVRVETQWSKERIERARPANEQTESEAERQHRESNLRRDTRRAELHSRAYEESKADAARLCPGKTFQDIGHDRKTLGRPDTLSNIRRSEESISKARNELVRLQAWVAKLPESVDIPQTKEAIERERQKYVKWVESATKEKARYEKWLEEHGNTD